MPQRLGRPPQRRHRIATLVRLDQRQQRGHQIRIQILGGLPAPAGPADPAVRQRILAGLQLEHPRPDRGLADPGRPRHRPHPAVAEQPGLLPQQQAAAAARSDAETALEPQDELPTDLDRYAHTSATRPAGKSNRLNLYGFSWWEFSARLFSPLCERCSTEGLTSR